jgi:alpha-L-arabinofuranosidase
MRSKSDNHCNYRLVAVFVALLASNALSATTGTLTVDVASPGAPITPMFYGLMTQEINHSFDGGRRNQHVFRS